MKMVKSLLLGSAAGLIAVAGAQAADLPVKAKAVEYVKICSLYGVGYYYIPGTDTCIKIGGYVRFEAYHNTAGGHYPNHIPGGGGGLTRHYNSFAMQARWRITTDVRTQTEYGTLRSYFAAGMNTLNAAYDQGPGVTTAIAIERAFIQFAGFTIGRVDTFFAFYNGAAYGLVPLFTDGSSGPAGHNVFAYTWQFGNGLSATLSLEDAKAHDRGVVDIAATGLLGPAFSAPTPTDSAGSLWPDVVANLRVDQAWGSAQIMGALHQVTARYDSIGVNPQCLAPNTTGCTHPSDEVGWAVGAGLTLKMPWDAKDTLSGVIAYSKGASSYVAYGQSNNWLHKTEVAVGAFNDGVFLSPGIAATNFQSGAISLTEVWGGTIAFEHYWTPALRTAFTFGYLEVNYSDEAKRAISLNNTACILGGVVILNGPAQCDPDWSLWRVTSRTMWNPVANLDVGLEIGYTKMNTAFAGTAVVGGANGLQTRIWNIQDESVWTGTVRVQRSFWP